MSFVSRSLHAPLKEFFCIFFAEVNECNESNLCEYKRNGGICTNTDGSYTCACLLGFSGNGIQPAKTLGSTSGTGCTREFRWLKSTHTHTHCCENSSLLEPHLLCTYRRLIHLSGIFDQNWKLHSTLSRTASISMARLPGIFLKFPPRSK